MNGYNIAFTNIDRQYQDLKSEILEITDQVLQSGQLMDGPHTKKFEQWLADRNQCRHAVTCHSGTQALQIIAEYILAGQTGKSARVAIPALTFPATANAWMLAGWEIELVDVDDYGLMLTDTIDHESVSAVCMVGLYGHALTNSLTHPIIIEDAAQHWLSNNCLRQGLASALSFDPTKNLNNYGNGGALVTNNDDLAVFARNWIGHGKFTQHRQAGSNSRLSEIDCAQLLIKTKYLNQWQARRRHIAEYWYKQLLDCACRSLIDQTNIDLHGIQKFVIEVPFQQRIQNHLLAHGIETKVHYVNGLDKLPVLQPANYCANAGRLANFIISLPIYPELTDTEVEFIIDRVLDCVS